MDNRIRLDEFVRALSSRPGLSGLTPLTRARRDSARDTATVIEQMLQHLRKKASGVRH